MKLIAPFTIYAAFTIIGRDTRLVVQSRFAVFIMRTTGSESAFALSKSSWPSLSHREDSLCASYAHNLNTCSLCHLSVRKMTLTIIQTSSRLTHHLMSLCCCCLLCCVPRQPSSMNRPGNNVKGKISSKSDGYCSQLAFVAVH